jgi:hypothetical protein
MVADWAAGVLVVHWGVSLLAGRNTPLQTPPTLFRALIEQWCLRVLKCRCHVVIRILQRSTKYYKCTVTRGAARYGHPRQAQISV